MKILVDLDFLDAARISNLPAAAAAGEPVVFEQLQAAIEGMKWKTSARVSTQSNLTLTAPGATIDGVTMASGDRILVRSQTQKKENGIYVWNGASTPATRTDDASTFNELEEAVISVEEGTDANTSWRQTAVNGTLGTDNIEFVPFGTVTPDATESTKGKAEIATQTETNTGTDDARIVTPLKLKNYSGGAKRYSASFGDGSATSFTITHNLGTRDVNVQVFETAGSYDMVTVDVAATTTNTITVKGFATAPTTNQYRVVVTA